MPNLIGKTRRSKRRPGTLAVAAALAVARAHNLSREQIANKLARVVGRRLVVDVEAGQ